MLFRPMNIISVALEAQGIDYEIFNWVEFTAIPEKAQEICLESGLFLNTLVKLLLEQNKNKVCIYKILSHSAYGDKYMSVKLI